MANTVMRIFYLVLILLCACQQDSEKSSNIEVYSINPIYQGLPPIGCKYGMSGEFYGEGIHPGIDYDIPIGTYIVAVSDGIVVFVGEPYKDQVYGGGYSVLLKHADDFVSGYAHLSEVFVTNGQNIKRGQRIGLSGQSNLNYPHLHFGLVRNSKRGSGKYFSQTYNPNDFWLGGKPQCFNPHEDYSINSFKKITFPVACSE